MKNYRFYGFIHNRSSRQGHVRPTVEFGTRSMVRNHSWFRDWVGLVVENSCPLCQRSTSTVFCQDCEGQIQQCKAPLSVTEPTPPKSPFIVTWGQYRGALKRSIATLKYQKHPEIARPLGEWLAQTWHLSMNSQRFTVVPIPMHDSKRKTRGFNQAELIARRFCEVTGLPLVIDGLIRIQATQAQFQMGSAANRLDNLTGAFQVGATFQRKLPHFPVLLVDDIYTTGATVQSATVALQQKGIAVAGVAVVARASLDREQ